jgi:hypothetical protein
LIIAKRDRDVVILVAVIIAIFSACLAMQDVRVFRLNSYLGNLAVYGYVIFLYAAFRIVRLAVVDRPDRLTKTIIERELNAERRQLLYAALPALACLIIFTPAFSGMKSAIPLFTEFTWDPYFIALDRQLHGTDPWLLLQPVFGYPIITSLLSMAYHFWVLLLYAFGIYFAFRSSDPVLRQRAFIAYFLCWAVVGVLMATGLASAGPCFAEPIAGRSDFLPLLDYLETANRHYPVMVLEVQASLLEGYRTGNYGLGRGITAMPSMHVSIAFLFFLTMRHISKAAAWVAGIFCVIIMIGSVHLAYHYAVDCYVAILVTALIWKAAGHWSNSSRYADTAPIGTPATAM